MARIVVPGGSGFLGQALVDRAEGFRFNHVDLEDEVRAVVAAGGRTAATALPAPHPAP